MQLQLENTEKGLALLIPEELIHNSRVTAGSTVDLTLIDGNIVIAPVRRSRYTTEELLAGVTDENIHGETDWGTPGSLVEPSFVDDKIVLAPARRSKYRIEDLMVGVTDENLPEKIDFGPPVGKELL